MKKNNFISKSLILLKIIKIHLDISKIIINIIMSHEQITPELNKNDPESLYKWVAYKVSCPDFRNTIKDFIDDYCIAFVDAEENILEYDQIFKAFNQLIEDLIKNILHEGKISKEEFLKMAEKGIKDIKYKKYFKNLNSFKDYKRFKSMMIKRNIQLEKMTKNQIIEKNQKNQVNQVNQVNQENKRNKFILIVSSSPEMTENPYAQDSQNEEKVKKKTPINKMSDIIKNANQTKITNKKDDNINKNPNQKDIGKKDEHNTPNCIINSLKQIIMEKIKINICDIEDEDPIMEEVDDEALEKNF
jgi:hypothetical protein